MDDKEYRKLAGNIIKKQGLQIAHLEAQRKAERKLLRRLISDHRYPGKFARTVIEAEDHLRLSKRKGEII